MHSRLALLVLLAGCLRSACENKKEVTFGAFVTHHWVEVLEPRNGARVQGVLVVKASVRRGSLGVLDDGFVTHLPFIVDSSQKWFDVPANESVYVTEARLRNFCDELGLGGDNCEHALASVQQLTEQRALWANGLSRNESACVVVTERARGEIAVCTELYRKCGIELYRKCGISEAALRAGVSLQTKGWTGTYDVSVEPRGFAGTQAPRNSPQAAASSVSVDVVASDCGVGDVRIVEPRKGALTPPTFVARAEGPAAACFVLDGGNARCEMCLGATGAPGRRNCEVSYDGVGPGRHRLAVFEAGGRCEARVDFEVGPASWAARTALAAAIGRPALITAASERYVTQRILENLVGSLHHWEPHRPLDVYDVGLSEAAVNLVSTWRNVNVLSVQSALDNVLSRTAVEAAKHVLNSSTYAFKALVILDALRRHGTAVLWLDANAELRRPLARIDAMIAEQGHFLVEHPFKFPTPQFHHPSAVAALGCAAAPLSREHCATTFVGVAARGWFARLVLPKLVKCSLNNVCINPPGSSRANHRQEQTALNAILCEMRAAPGVCTNDKRFRMTSDFENDRDSMQPTSDELDWNAVHLYTRRGHPIKPYVRYVRFAVANAPPD